MASAPVNVWARKDVPTNVVVDTVTPPLSMREIMDEEIARQLQEKEDDRTLIPAKTKNNLIEIINDSDDWATAAAAILGSKSRDQGAPQGSEDDACVNDFLLAQLLQSQFDREHDKLLELEEKKWNGNEKVHLSFQNYRTQRSQDLYGVDSSSAESEDEDVKEQRNIKLDVRKTPDFGASGVIKQNDGKMLTKHDKVVCGRKNTDRVMEFPPEFQTGDVVKMDMQLPNSVYNTLKTHMIQEEKRMHRLLDKKDKATSELALDMNTRIVIYKMINSGLLESVTGTVATGKEAIVLHARGGDSTEEKVAIPAECALKVYITMLVDFKNRSQYVKEDYRFKNRRKVLKIWAEKELMNLNRMKRAGIRCPNVVKLKKHVLVMSFIGDNGVPAPKLKEVRMDDQEQMQKAFDQCFEAMKLMYDECKLVHGDFSEFNVLYWNGDCYVIDVSQAMDLSHPKSLLFLARDCRNLIKFFEKSGLESTPTLRELFVRITGLENVFGPSADDDSQFYIVLEEYVNENACSNQKRGKRASESATAAENDDDRHTKK